MPHSVLTLSAPALQSYFATFLTDALLPVEEEEAEITDPEPGSKDDHVSIFLQRLANGDASRPLQRKPTHSRMQNAVATTAAEDEDGAVFGISIDRKLNLSKFHAQIVHFKALQVCTRVSQQLRCGVCGCCCLRVRCAHCAPE